MGNTVAQAAEGAYKNVMGNISPQIPYMGEVIHRKAAAVKANFAGNQRFKALKPASKGVKQGKRGINRCGTLFHYGISGFFMDFLTVTLRKIGEKINSGAGTAHFRWL